MGDVTSDDSPTTPRGIWKWTGVHSVYDRCTYSPGVHDRCTYSTGVHDRCTNMTGVQYITGVIYISDVQYKTGVRIL